MASTNRDGIARPRFGRLGAMVLAMAAAGCTTDGGGAMPPEATPTLPDCPATRNWNAWINAMPGPGAVPTLIVTGEVEAPAGMAVTLEPGPLDRMMPPAQRFRLIVAPGKGAPGWQEVRAEVRPAVPAYRAVIIGCGEAEIARIEDVGTAY